MIELLILFELTNKVLTMYGISRGILGTFSVLTTPSFGTIKPALTRLEENGFIKGQKTMSEGGRPSVYYSITKAGVEELKRLIMEPPLENPIHFLTSARIKLACADVLSRTEQKELISQLKMKAEIVLVDTKNLLAEKEFSLYPSLVFTNLSSEYQNFISLLEGVENAGNS